jgi:hypothetical protein
MDKYYRALLLEIAQDLSQEELSELKVACRSYIPDERAEFITTPHELFQEMERMGILSVGYRWFLARSLDTIGRRDLRYKLIPVTCKLQPLK